MTTAYTSLLGLALPVTGELSGTWGDTVNNSITSLLDSAIAGTTTLSADTTLTTTTGASNQARQAILLCTGQVANITITAPAQSKIYTVINASATYTVKIRGAGPTTGITIPVSSTATVAWNGTDFVDATNYINGNIILGSGTANGVAYLNATKQITTGSALVFNGTNLGLGVTPSASTASGVLFFNNAGQFTFSGPIAYQDVNIVYNSSADRYIANGAATRFSSVNGVMSWYNAPSGTAGNAITFTQAMTLDASGNLSIGATSTTGKLLAAGTGYNILGNAYGVATFLQDTTTARGVFMGYDSTGQIGTVSAGSNGAASSLAFWTYSGSAWAEAARIDSSGNLGVGTTSPSGRLDVQNNQNATSNFYFRNTDTTNTSSRAALNVIAGSQSFGFLAINADNTFIQRTSGSLQFQLAGSTQATLDTSGNFGLGVTPSAWNASSKAFQIGASGNVFLENYNGVTYILGYNAYRSVASGYLYTTTGYSASLFGSGSTGGFQWNIAPSGTAGNAITFTQAMTLDAGGRLLLTDTSTPVADALFSAASSNTTDGAWSARVISRNTGNDTSVFMANWRTNSSTKNAVIAAHNAALTGWGNLYVNTTDGSASNSGAVIVGGNLLVGTTGNTFGAKLNVIPPYAAVGASFEASNSTYPCIATWNNQGNYPAKQIAFHIGASSPTEVGSITSTATATSYVTSSDYRLKNTITPMTGALAKVAALKPVAYKWNIDGSDGEGFIAHELAEVCPHAVTGEKDAVNEDGKPVHQGVDYGKITPLLTAALQEAIAKIELLEARLASLESK